jgi:hypothetical protein
MFAFPKLSVSVAEVTPFSILDFQLSIEKSLQQRVCSGFTPDSLLIRWIELSVETKRDKGSIKK